MGHRHESATFERNHDHCAQAPHHHAYEEEHRPHSGHEGQATSTKHEAGALSTKEKLARMLDHWKHHNEDHGASYRRWAQQARSEGLDQVAQTLEAVAESSLALNELLDRARLQLDM